MQYTICSAASLIYQHAFGCFCFRYCLCCCFVIVAVVVVSTLSMHST